VYAFVQPTTGRTYGVLLPTVSIAAFNVAFAEFARDTGTGATKQVVLVLDQAGWHRSGKVVRPAGVELAFLPPYSPELQPAERLWRLTDEVLVNRHFATLDELPTVQAAHCLRIQAMPDVVRAHTYYHWWPTG
jgi:transposase